MGNNRIKKVGIFYLDGVYIEELAKELSTYLRKKSVDIVYRDEIKNLSETENLVLISLGGDGTFLKASCLAIKLGVPVFGVNLGSLGFLTDVEGVDIYSAADALLSGDFLIEKRIILKATVISEGIENRVFNAVNDFVLMRSINDRILQSEILANGINVGKFRSDGLVFSTATGSTAYSLSLGGPIVVPNADVFLLAFMAPHKLSARTVVFANSDKVSVRVLSDGQFNVQRDGEEIAKLKMFDRLTIEKSEKDLNIIHLKSKNFFDVLNKKFGWGI
jgi:NAD+ kinase